MRLTDVRIRNAKPTAKSYKLSDGGGMYLLVMPDGARLKPSPLGWHRWRLYRALHGHGLSPILVVRGSGCAEMRRIR